MKTKLENLFKSMDKKLILILLVAFFLRIFKSWDVPTLHVDEGYAFYSAKCLLNYGKDIWGKGLSVYSSAWGAGMSMGYIYFSIPFLALFGQHLFIFRLPMILMGTLAVYFMYKIGCFKSKNTGYIMALLYATVPWSVMQQRWALDCNFFIVLFIPGLYFMLKYLTEKKKSSLYTSLIIFGLSLYGYALSYLYVPVVLLFVVLFLMAKKEFVLKDWIVPSLILFTIASPLMVFVFNNLFNLGITDFGIFEFPKLLRFRSNEVGFSPNNFISLFNLVFLNTDNYVINTFYNTGLLYYWTFPFLCLGTYVMYCKEKTVLNSIMKRMFAISLLVPLFGFVAINAYKSMLYIIPAIYCICIGAEFILEKVKKDFIKITLTSLYFLGVCLFFITYLFNQNAITSTYDYCMMPELTPWGVSDVIKYTEEHYPNEEKYIQFRRTFMTPILFNELDVVPSEGNFEREIYYFDDGETVNYDDFGRVEDYIVFTKVEDGKLVRPGNTVEVGTLVDSLIIGLDGVEELSTKDKVYCSNRYCLYK